MKGDIEAVDNGWDSLNIWGIYFLGEDTTFYEAKEKVTL